MRGYKAVANEYRKAVATGKLLEEAVAHIISAYDILEEVEEKELYAMVDSSAFNFIIESFCKKALREASVDDETEKAVMYELRKLFDEMTAREVCDSIK